MIKLFKQREFYEKSTIEWEKGDNIRRYSQFGYK